MVQEGDMFVKLTWSDVDSDPVWVRAEDVQAVSIGGVNVITLHMRGGGEVQRYPGPLPIEREMEHIISQLENVLQSGDGC